MSIGMWETKSPSVEATVAYVYTCADFFAAPIKDSDSFINWLINLDIEYQEAAFNSLENLFILFQNKTILERWEEALLGNPQKRQPGIVDDKKASTLLQSLLYEYPGLHEVLKQFINKNHKNSCFILHWYQQANEEINLKSTNRIHDISQELELLVGPCKKLDNLINDFLKKHNKIDKNKQEKIQPIIDLQEILADKNLDPLTKLVRCKQIFDNNADDLMNPNFAPSHKSFGTHKSKTNKVTFYATSITKDLYYLAHEIDKILNSAKKASASQPPAQQAPTQYKAK